MSDNELWAVFWACALIMYKYIDLIIFALSFAFVVVQMAISAKNQDVCWTIMWGVLALDVWLGMLVMWLKG